MEGRYKAMGTTHSSLRPGPEILSGDETDRLHRWGYTRYRDLFNPRQLLGLELSCRMISQCSDQRIRHALATNLSDLLRYQNMLCRYDTTALKSLDIFSVHGFPVGWYSANRISRHHQRTQPQRRLRRMVQHVHKYAKAKLYCTAPFEVRRQGTRNVRIPIKGEWIGDTRNGQRRKVAIRCASATAIDLSPESLDAVFTDPPYFGNVQYSELMDFCYVWLRRLVGNEADGFERSLTRSQDELNGNITRNHGLDHFTEGLSAVYSRMAQALKPGAPLAFTYHHNKLETYHAVGVAILDAELVVSATLPCPAEMGGSIHIHGTSSSIIDTVFVCRTSGKVPRHWIFDTPEQLAAIVAVDLADLEQAGRTPTRGDTRCIVFGHLTRMAVWKLRQHWDKGQPIAKKLAAFGATVSSLGDPAQILELVAAAEPVPISPGPFVTKEAARRRDK